MAKKIKIHVDFTEDNYLFGVSCHKRDYWIAYHLNDVLRINLRRITDFPFYQSKLDEILEYPLFHDFSNDEQLGYFLISNFNSESLLFPELKTTDFFVLVQGRLADGDESGILSGIRGINGVLTAFVPETKKLKEYDNFLSDLELHLTSLKVKD